MRLIVRLVAALFVGSRALSIFLSKHVPMLCDDNGRRGQSELLRLRFCVLMVLCLNLDVRCFVALMTWLGQWQGIGAIRVMNIVVGPTVVDTADICNWCSVQRPFISSLSLLTVIKTFSSAELIRWRRRKSIRGGLFFSIFPSLRVCSNGGVSSFL